MIEIKETQVSAFEVALHDQTGTRFIGAFKTDDEARNIAMKFKAGFQADGMRVFVERSEQLPFFGYAPSVFVLEAESTAFVLVNEKADPVGMAFNGPNKLKQNVGPKEIWAVDMTGGSIDLQQVNK